MIKGLKNWNMRNIAISLLFLLIITDLTILLEIPILREILSFLYFSIVPGLLILIIFKLDKIEFIKKFILSAGLSISLLMFLGLLVNSFYPYIREPLSTLPMLLSLNLLILTLVFIALKRNKEATFEGLVNINTNFEDKSLSLLIFPALFPFLVIFGTSLMNNFENNAIILFMLILVPVYIALILLFKGKVHQYTYPFSIWILSLSFLLLHGLTSNQILGIDVHSEFYIFQLTLDKLHWNAYSIYNAYNSCISITILPTIYKVLTGLSGEYVFKLIYAFIGSFVPLTAYVLFKKYFSLDKSFLASLLIIFQGLFMQSLGYSRQLTALLFFFMAIFVLFDTEIDEKFKKIIFLISIFSIIISHYSTTFVALALIIPILLLPFLKNLVTKRKLSFKNFDILIISVAFLALWYIIFAQSQLMAGTSGLGMTVSGAPTETTSGVSTSRDSSVLAIIGIGITSLPNLISVISNDIVFLMIFVGLIATIFNLKFYRKKMDSGFILAAFICVLILASFIVLPIISKLYGVPRLFLQCLIFLAPIFIIGVEEVAKKLRIPKMDYLLIFTILILLFSTSTYLQYSLTGMPYSPYYEKDGMLRNEYFIYDQEVIASEWLNGHYINRTKTYTDAIGSQRLLLRYDNYRNIDDSFYLRNKTISKGYIYLWNTNLHKGLVYTRIEKQKNLSDYSHLLVGKNIIYDNGFSQVRS